MEIVSGMFVAAPRQDVWTFLADAEKLSSCVRGLETAEIDADGLGFGGPATLALGNQALRFPARVAWLQQQPPEGGRLRAGAQVAGHEFSGEGTIQLTEAGSGTEVQWHLDIILPSSLQENRVLAQMVHNVATMVLDAFFACVQERLREISDG
jgi:carbon monoxide dehydrogenase subunit G